MTGTALMRRRDAMLDELRAAWRSGRRVAVTLEGVERERLEGVVQRVSVSGDTVKVGAVSFPAAALLAVHLPSRLGDSRARDRFHGDARVLAGDGEGQLTLSID